MLKQRFAFANIILRGLGQIMLQENSATGLLFLIGIFWLYDFSAALVGVALILYFEPTFIIWLAIISGSVLTTILQHLFIIKKTPVFTLLFVLVTWAIIFLFQNFYPVAPSIFLSTTIHVGYDFTFAFRGFGQVIFQSSVFAGDKTKDSIWDFISVVLSVIISLTMFKYNLT